jgi:chlorobactene glucosyltransferase
VEVFIAFVTFFLILIALITILNALTFPRLFPLPPPFDFRPSVSVLVPARNESAVIAGTVEAWLAQEYTDFELLILDDNSSDSTAEIAQASARGDPRLRVLAGAPLPEGWKGKSWACHQLAEAARGDLLLFTDADVTWQPGALSALVGEVGRSRADLLSVWPKQITHTWAERLVVPLMGFVFLGYLPILAVHYVPWPVFSAAIGQCLVIRRPAYQAIGGHASVREALVEDMALAWNIKHKRLRLRLADGTRLGSVRMYRNWPEVRDGFAKNILAGHANRISLLFLSALIHWSLFLFPCLWLAIGWALPVPGWPVAPVVLSVQGMLIRALTAAVTHQRIGDAVTLPISIISMTLITARAVQWHFSGGPRWKGRVYGKSKYSRVE